MHHTRIKFCGFTRPADLELAVELGVDFVGLIFAPRSRRRVSLQAAQALRAAVPETIGVVALCMDNEAAEVQALVDAVRPDVLQFHGAETEAFAAQFGVPYWKAVAMGGGMADARLAIEFAKHPSAAAFLLDGHGAGEQGGSGKAFDWNRVPQAAGKPLLLAGGLSPGNVAEAIRTARPWGVDVSSGIETAPGEKSPEKMRAFVAAARST